ncbi:hypothetical protein CHCC15075_4159 [Bacillus licheniformis]|nr:hypothetical protein B4094_2338 [Bacillus licheniformis]TWM67538.1 hypothetical protein CHCC14814_4254 [Bacillus paralicheniformis]TWK59438.1 hypothetical protein CHCC20342_3706 [Bacillus licheniformis]TWK95600.1 hypothetical protein CHCC20323_3646 [Bacillus licheniformis]TWM24310.1 hypothetical protein CHCC15075_4159 [Bacillus licheniformis]
MGIVLAEKRADLRLFFLCKIKNIHRLKQAEKPCEIRFFS